MPRRFLLLLLPLLAFAGADASAQVRRCETADGRTVYTDKPCPDVGAVERLQHARDPGQSSLYRRQCSRSVQDLAFEVTMAIDGRDANRLAGSYHWPGMPTRNAYTVMERLDAIVNRPLVDVRALYPESDARPAMPPATPAPDAAAPPPSSEIMRSRRPWRPLATPQVPQADAVDTVAAETPALSPPVRRTPYALQVDQTLANGSTPARTVFGLRRHLGCWWISL